MSRMDLCSDTGITVSYTWKGLSTGDSLESDKSAEAQVLSLTMQLRISQVETPNWICKLHMIPEVTMNHCFRSLESA